MAYTGIKKSKTEKKSNLNLKASKDNFVSKTESAKKLIEKVGLPLELKLSKQ
jgi:hypothetical protein